MWVNPIFVRDKHPDHAPDAVKLIVSRLAPT